MLVQLITKINSVESLSDEELLKKRIQIEVEQNKRDIIRRITKLDENIKKKFPRYEEYCENVLKYIDIVSQIKNIEHFHYQYLYRLNCYDENKELYYVYELNYDYNGNEFNEMMKNYKDFYLTISITFIYFLQELI